MSWLSKGASGVGNVVKGVLGIGGTPGPQNPFGVPDLSYLKDTSKLDYLKNPDLYKSLLSTKGFDFLKTPSSTVKSASEMDSLPDNLKTFGGTYKAPGYGNSNSMYQSLIDSTNAPSSVDDVRTQLSTEQLQNLLTGIDSDTKNSVGSLKADFADRGLGGPGMLSDIEGNSLAQAYATGDKTKANARLGLEQSTLDLMKNRENQNLAARTAAAGAAEGQDTQANQIAATGAEGDVNNYNSAYMDAIKSKIAAEDSAAGRTQTNQLNYANLLNSNTQDYNSLINGNSSLFAQLLNARDLGAAGINSTNYNTAQGQQYQYAKPGPLETLLGNTKINLGF